MFICNVFNVYIKCLKMVFVPIIFNRYQTFPFVKLKNVYWEVISAVRNKEGHRNSDMRGFEKST